MAEETGGHCVTTAAWRSTGSDESCIGDLLEQQFLYVIEATLIDSLSEKLARRLCEVLFQLGHVDIVDEEDLSRVGHLGSQQILTLQVEVTFEGVL